VILAILPSASSGSGVCELPDVIRLGRPVVCSCGSYFETFSDKGQLGHLSEQLSGFKAGSDKGGLGSQLLTRDG